MRRAIVLSLDRELIVRAVFGSYGEVPYGPASPILWISHGAPKPAGPNRSRGPAAPGRARLGATAMATAFSTGRASRCGSTSTFPTPARSRRQMALLAQQQLRQTGIDVVLRQFDFPVYFERRHAGHFDIDFSSTIQDPSPSGLTQGWSCGGTTNVAHYCDPRVDSLIERAISSSDGARAAWHAVLRQIEDDAPAAFMYAPSYVFAVNRRFGNVTIRPESSWIGALEVDRGGAGRPARRRALACAAG